TPLPGPAAFVAALSAAGAPTDKFTFAGFPPSKALARGKFFAGLSPHAATLVFYESPSRLADSLAAMADAFGARRACVAREITKLHEEFREGELAGLADHYRETPPKGEIVVVVHPPKPQGPPGEDEIDAFLVHALERQSVKEAAAAAANALGVSKNLAYARALLLKDKR
ncbi:MAG: rRNA (cytidine-2'-O-)-methyltransferase, partial [Parvularculaceae bacterium]|nr:rRNA (cytidine-2'-O-)-methyltransferase [Parvularculaceae bacterium]